MNKVNDLRAEQRYYAATQGGMLGVREADNVYNDYNRKIIETFRQTYGSAYIGSINFYDKNRIAVANGTMSPIGEYHGQHLYNFSCDFVIPKQDVMLETLIRKWNDGNGSGNPRMIEDITDRILAIGGEMLIWY